MRISASTRAVTVGGVETDGSPASILAATRATQSATRLQVRLALGPDACATLDAAAIDPLVPWAMREMLRSVSVWGRVEQPATELQWLLNMTASELDQLFELAQTL